MMTRLKIESDYYSFNGELLFMHYADDAGFFYKQLLCISPIYYWFGTDKDHMKIHHTIRD